VTIAYFEVLSQDLSGMSIVGAPAEIRNGNIRNISQNHYRTSRLVRHVVNDLLEGMCYAAGLTGKNHESLFYVRAENLIP
jgi:hypothetical protein